ncbi:hypothetical protein CB1_000873007 [Camelus ferus]|nr:hypothetical protein CB1_000873007 [Camelus ferus]
MRRGVGRKGGAACTVPAKPPFSRSRRLHALPRPHKRPLNECRGKNSSEPGLIASVSPTFTAERETLSFRWVPQPDGPPSYIRVLLRCHLVCGLR